jgi:hypothetical protein
MKFQILRFFDVFFLKKGTCNRIFIEKYFSQNGKNLPQKQITHTRLVLPQVPTKLGNGRRLVLRVISDW